MKCFEKTMRKSLDTRTCVQCSLRMQLGGLLTEPPLTFHAIARYVQATQGNHQVYMIIRRNVTLYSDTI
jgi:hypothetical protein